MLVFRVQGISSPIRSCIHRLQYSTVFHGKGGKPAWQAWNALEEKTMVFGELESMPESLPKDDKLAVKKFVVVLYDGPSW